METNSEKVVVFHGLSSEEAFAAMKAVKAALAGGGASAADVAFAMSTPTNLGWKLSELVAHVREEHESMKPR